VLFFIIAIMETNKVTPLIPPLDEKEWPEVKGTYAIDPNLQVTELHDFEKLKINAYRENANGCIVIPGNRYTYSYAYTFRRLGGKWSEKYLRWWIPIIGGDGKPVISFERTWVDVLKELEDVAKQFSTFGPEDGAALKRFFDVWKSRDTVKLYDWQDFVAIVGDIRGLCGTLKIVDGFCERAAEIDGKSCRERLRSIWFLHKGHIARFLRLVDTMNQMRANKRAQRMKKRKRPLDDEAYVPDKPTTSNVVVATPNIQPAPANGAFIALFEAAVAEGSLVPLKDGVKDVVHRGSCVMCNNADLNFRDELSKKEFGMSGMCQKCQDGFFT
jgi:hypothetical protein